MAANAMIRLSDNKFVILLIINLLLLACGCLLETNSSILILAPILYPVVAMYDVDIVHFGIIMVVNLAIGFITPPVGVNLFVACGIGNIPFARLVKKIVPFLIRRHPFMLRPPEYNKKLVSRCKKSRLQFAAGIKIQYASSITSFYRLQSKKSLNALFNDFFSRPVRFLTRCRAARQ